jgi:primase-polymerase (primpol)-like protein
MTEDARCATEIAKRHPGWIVWNSRPTATRARKRARFRNDGVFAMTVEASTWSELDAKLAEQDAHDAEFAAQP